MYIINTTLLDEVHLLVERCGHWISVAWQTLDYIREYPDEEGTELQAFANAIDESNDDFANSTFRLAEIASLGRADDLLYKEVRNNLLNSKDIRQEEMYMEGVVFPVGQEIKQVLISIRELREKASFDGEDDRMLCNELNTLIHEMTVNPEKQKELEQEMSIIIGWLRICQFYRSMTILEAFLKKLSYIDGTSGYELSQKLIKETVDEPKVSQARLALFYFYTHEKKCLSPFQAGRMEKEYRKAVEPYGLSWKQFQLSYNRFKHQSERMAEGNRVALSDVLKMLEPYPDALEMAKDELRTAETRTPRT